ncbi:glycosyltransferase family 4 protein [Undibacterium fentianense]|uniref:Glycosyltransferase n=1 Tax=Undibacterium fentianense TaxID=2828728 RepID=A0A941EAE0_9BURK|nr:glycosyltransferase [Undibacterium fentianense]MBR7801488.1 glycosyltransferase [Undibacterium fentianense]
MAVKSIHQFISATQLDATSLALALEVQKKIQGLGLHSTIFSDFIPAQFPDVSALRSIQELKSDSSIIMLIDGHDVEQVPVLADIKCLQLAQFLSLHKAEMARSPSPEQVSNTRFLLERCRDACLIVTPLSRAPLAAGVDAWEATVEQVSIMLGRLKALTDLPLRVVLVGSELSNAQTKIIQQHIATSAFNSDIVLQVISDFDTSPQNQSRDQDQGVHQDPIWIETSTWPQILCFADMVWLPESNDCTAKVCRYATAYHVPIVACENEIMRREFGTGMKNNLFLSNTVSAQEQASVLLTLLKEPRLRAFQVQLQDRAWRRQALQRSLDRIDPSCVLALDLNEFNVEAESWLIEGPCDSHYSLAIVNRELARGLKKLDAPHLSIALRSMEGHGDFDAAADFVNANPDCAEMLTFAKQIGIPSVAARFCYPPHVANMVAQTKLIHSYGWEETGFPQHYVAEFNRRLNGVAVLSNTVAKILRDSGVRIPIAVTGAGVDQYQEQEQGLSVSAATRLREARRFQFLHVSSCFPRKGVDVLLRAYGAAFRADDDVSLIIKTFSNPHNQVAQDLQFLRDADRHFPHVLLIEEEWSHADMSALYQQANVFVAPSRGEGFGLPIAEAMLYGVPVITTAWGGQTDFCTEKTAWLCDYTFAKANTHLGLTHSLWAEPDVKHLTQQLRELYQSTFPNITSLVQAKVDAARTLIQEKFGWQQTAQNLRSLVCAIHQQPLVRKEPQIAWISSWNARCGIANYSHFLTQNFPAHRLHVLANHIPERTGIDQDFVLRSWEIAYDENLENAIDYISEHQISAVVVQYNFGFFSPENLGLFIQSMHDLGVAVYVFFHSTADVFFGGRHFALKNIQPSLRQVERIFVHSIEDMNRLKDLGLVEQLCYFPHGIAPVPSNLPAPSAKRVIASYGFLLPHKGIQQLIRAFAALEPERNDLHLLLLNALYPVPVSQDEANACLQLIAQLGLQSRVCLKTDFMADADVLQLLAQAEVIVFPYQHTQESSSAATRVGLTAGRPVLVTPLAIFSDVEEAVHRLSGTEPEQIAEGIRYFLENPHVASEKAEQVAAWIRERSWPHLSNRLLNIIDGIANPLEHYVR